MPKVDDWGGINEKRKKERKLMGNTPKKIKRQENEIHAMKGTWFVVNIS